MAYPDLPGYYYDEQRQRYFPLYTPRNPIRVIQPPAAAQRYEEAWRQQKEKSKPKRGARVKALRYSLAARETNAIIPDKEPSTPAALSAYLLTRPQTKVQKSSERFIECPAHEKLEDCFISYTRFPYWPTESTTIINSPDCINPVLFFVNTYTNASVLRRGCKWGTGSFAFNGKGIVQSWHSKRYSERCLCH